MDVVRRQLGENTRAVHLPQAPVPEQQPLGTPVYRTAAFAFRTGDEYASVLNDERPGYAYSRIDNPTVDAFARAVAALEGRNLPAWPAAQAFASGMAAISGVFLTFARMGAHIVAPAAIYGGTYSFLRNVAGRFGAVVTITPHGGREAAMTFADRLRLAQLATSLGGTHTKASHAASTTHRQLDSRAQMSAGIDPGAVRFSIGLEDAEDLISDAYVALDSLGRP